LGKVVPDVPQEVMPIREEPQAKPLGYRFREVVFSRLDVHVHGEILKKANDVVGHEPVELVDRRCC
jgi:hypothetical protein